MKGRSVFRPPYRRRWPISELLTGWVIGLITSISLTPALDGYQTNLVRARMIALFFVLALVRVLVAVWRKEESIGWAFWLPVFVFFAPIWILILEPFIWSFR